MDMNLKQNSIFENDDNLIIGSEISELLYQWKNEVDKSLKEKLKLVILRVIQKKERQTFIARYFLRDFDSWNNVLTEEEGSVSKAHKAAFYKPYLVMTLFENDGFLPALEAVSKTMEKVQNELSLADYKLTASKRFRYDTTIRFLADSLKKQGILSTEKKHKNKDWALTEKGNAYANELINGVKSKAPVKAGKEKGCK